MSDRLDDPLKLEPRPLPDAGNQPRLGDWMLTASGRAFWPLDPRAEEVDIDDIATALSHQGRYYGHTRHYYSTAQHSTEMARWFMAKRDAPMAREALLHDGQEAYVGDVIRPLKPFLPGYAEIEGRCEVAVRRRFGLAEEMPAAVKQADRQILVDEMIALFPADALARFGLAMRARLGLEIRPLFPTVARDRFMATFRELFP